MLSEEQKQQILYPVSSSKSSLLRASTFISEKVIDWHQTIMIKMIGKDVEWRTKTEILSPLSSSKSLLLRTSSYISEKVIDWHQTIMIKSIGKTGLLCQRAICPHYFWRYLSKKHSKSPTNHFLLQLKQVWVKSKLCSFCKPPTWWKTTQRLLLTKVVASTSRQLTKWRKFVQIRF